MGRAPLGTVPAEHLFDRLRRICRAHQRAESVANRFQGSMPCGRSRIHPGQAASRAASQAASQPGSRAAGIVHWLGVNRQFAVQAATFSELAQPCPTKALRTYLHSQWMVRLRHGQMAGHAGPAEYLRSHLAVQVGGARRCRYGCANIALGRIVDCRLGVWRVCPSSDSPG
jgi:hypothetical protein